MSEQTKTTSVAAASLALTNVSGKVAGADGSLAATTTLTDIVERRHSRAPNNGLGLYSAIGSGALLYHPLTGTGQNAPDLLRRQLWLQFNSRFAQVHMNWNNIEVNVGDYRFSADRAGVNWDELIGSLITRGIGIHLMVWGVPGVHTLKDESTRNLLGTNGVTRQARLDAFRNFITLAMQRYNTKAFTPNSAGAMIWSWEEEMDGWWDAPDNGGIYNGYGGKADEFAKLMKVMWEARHQPSADWILLSPLAHETFGATSYPPGNPHPTSFDMNFLTDLNNCTIDGQKALSLVNAFGYNFYGADASWPGAYAPIVNKGISLKNRIAPAQLGTNIWFVNFGRPNYEYYPKTTTTPLDKRKEAADWMVMSFAHLLHARFMANGFRFRLGSWFHERYDMVFGPPGAQNMHRYGLFCDNMLTDPTVAEPANLKDVWARFTELTSAFYDFPTASVPTTRGQFGYRYTLPADANGVLQYVHIYWNSGTSPIVDVTPSAT